MKAKIYEGNDGLMNGNTPFYPSKFEMFSPMVKLMLEMSEPIHGSGRVVTLDSGFCATAGILVLHDVGVFWQALIKRGDASSQVVSPATKLMIISCLCR